LCILDKVFLSLRSNEEIIGFEEVEENGYPPLFCGG